MAELVADAAREGHVRPDIDPAAAARLLFGMVNSLTEWVRPNCDPEDTARTVCLIAFHGMLLPAE